MPVLLVCEQRACTNILARAERSLYRVHHGQAIDIMAYPPPRHGSDERYEASSPEIAQEWLSRVSRNLDTTLRNAGHTMHFVYDHFLQDGTRRPQTILGLASTPDGPVANWLADVTFPSQTVSDLIDRSPHWTGWHGTWHLSEASWHNRCLNVVFRWDGGQNLEPIDHHFYPQATNGLG